MSKVLITGAAGFIGFHLANHLTSLGNQVLGIDNFNDYYDPSLKRTRAQELKKAGVEILELDIADKDWSQKIPNLADFSHIVHLAAQAGVRYSTENPRAYIRSNIEGFLNILETCRANPHVYLTYASSSSVYGLNDSVPFQPSDRTDHQASLYGVTKKCNELMAFSYNHLYGIRNTGLRFFTVYGPWGRPDMAYYRFTHAMVQGKPIDLFNFGEMERDFTYIDDIVEGIHSSMQLQSPCAVYNLGNNRPEKLSTLVALIEENLGRKADVRLLPMQPGDVTRTYADIELSQAVLSFAPKTSLKEGISRFVSWYRSFHG